MVMMVLYTAWALLNLLIVLLAGGGIVLRIAAERLVVWQKFLTNEMERRRA